MLPVYILTIVPFLFKYIKIKGISYKEKDKRVLDIFFFLLLIFVAFRHHTVGNDTSNYIYYFETIGKSSLTSISSFATEVCFLLYNKAIYFFTNNEQIYIFITTYITLIFIKKTYLRLCEDSILTIVLFCIMSTFPMLFSGMRQMLAVSIGFIAYKFVKEKKLFHFLIITFIAIGFHNSAFMLLFMYPLFYAKITKKWLLLVVPSIIGIFIFNEKIFSVLIELLSSFSRYDASISPTGAYTMIVLLFLFSVFSYIIPKEDELDEESKGLRNFLLFSLVIQLFAPLNTLAMRMNYYYIIFIPLLIPKIIKYRDKRWNKVAILARYVMVIFFLFYFIISSKSGGGLNVFPYHFFWEAI